MDKLDTTQPAMAFAILALIVFLAIIPMLIAESKTGKILNIATAALCLTSLVGTVGSIALGVLGVLIVAPALSAMWMASLICGIACCLNKAADKRANDMVFRLLYNEAESLKKPDNVSSIRRGPD